MLGLVLEGYVLLITVIVFASLLVVWMLFVLGQTVARYEGWVLGNVPRISRHAADAVRPNLI